MRIITPLLKVGLGGGAIYFAAEQGLFSESQRETIKASKRISESVPGLVSYVDKVPILVSKEEVINYWNSGVKIMISVLATLPTDSKELISKGKEEMQNQLKNMQKK